MAHLKIPFEVFCDCCEKIICTTSNSEKETLLIKFIKKYKKLDNECRLLEADLCEKPTCYPVLRLLIPQYERERGPYGLKENSFAKLYTKTLCLGNKDANILLNYKINTSMKSANDFAEAAYKILRKWCPDKSSLTIADVNKYLDTLALNYAEHKQRNIEADLYKLIRSSTAKEQKWLVRIILKDMKLGLGNDKILRIFHQDAADLYNICSNLAKVCEDLNNSDICLHELEIVVFTPFRPMLCLRCDSTILNTVLTETKIFYVENKFDGERFQLHMKDGVFKYFSKNGYDYTETYGATYDSTGLITPYLSEIFKNITSVILDGEMMGWNTKTKNFGSKGMKFDVKNLKVDSVHRPCFCVFDLLLYNNKILTNLPLSERLNILDSFLVDIKGIIMKSVRTHITSKEELLAKLRVSVDNEEEGICFKDSNSIYKPNNRKGGWWKMKLEYFEGHMKELDVIIIGAYYGEGKRLGLINSFLLAVAVAPEKACEFPKEFHSFAKVATGFTADELNELLDKLKTHWKPVDKDETPQGIFWRKEKPDIWIDPKKSCILQVKASELALSTEFYTDYTLRFPRVEKVRYDKPWYNCMTTEELKGLTINSKAVQKLNDKHLTIDDIEVVPKKRKRKEIIHQPITCLGDAVPKSSLFQNKEICVYSGNEMYSKENIELKVLEHGGKIVQYDGSTTFCVLVGDITPRIKVMLDQNPRDIVKLDWFLRAIYSPSTSLLKWAPEDFVSISKKTKLEILKNFTKYGDSYTEPVTETKLKTIFNNISLDDEYLNLMPQEMNKIDEMLSFKNPLGLFRNCYAYFDSYSLVNDITSEKIKLLHNIENGFRFFGGVQYDIIKYYTTHVVVHTRDISRVEDIKRVLAHFKFEKVKIVNEKWIENCMESKKLLNESLYVL